MSQNKVVEGRDAKTGRFLAGNSGNGGRKVGSRNRLGEAFIADLHAAWTKHGKGVIDRVIRDDPAQFLKTVAAVLPRQLDETLNLNLSVIAEAKTFDEAFRFALKHIGSEIEANEPKLIEAGGDALGPD